MTSSLKKIIFFLSPFSGVSATVKVLISKKQEVEGDLVRFFFKTKGSACRFAVTICDRKYYRGAVQMSVMADQPL